MSTEPRPGNRSLPDRPNLRHLKNQAKDLFRGGGPASLTDAQLRLARDYGFSSWPALKAHVESLQEVGALKEAIDANDLATVTAMMTRNPALHSAPMGYNNNGPLTWTAECRGAAPTAERLAIARWMIENGSDVHQGRDGPLMRAALSDVRIPMMELLVEHGADVNALWDGRYPIVCAPCETLQAGSLKWLLQHGADPHTYSEEYGSCVQMLVCTYWRHPAGKHACLEVFAEAGYSFPDTAPMAVHRGRIDLLEACLQREPTLPERRFSESDIYPPDLGIKPRDGLHGAPLEGATLLHLAIEYCETEIAQWLIDRGADVNAPTTIDADGFGGHTPLFHTTVTLGPKTDDLAGLLLRHGADSEGRATLRKQLRHTGNPETEKVFEYHNTDAIDFARQFPEPVFVNESAITAIQESAGS